MKKMLNGKWINVFKVDETRTSWGYTYNLYTSDSVYYVTESDASDEVIELGKFDNDESAIEEFKKYMEELEKEISEEN